MSSPHRVLFRPQLSDPTTYLDGLNCTAAAGAMAIDRATLGRVRVWGGEVRARTGDVRGGTTLSQIAAAARTWGVTLDEQRGYPLGGLYARLRSGQGAIVQGASLATKGTAYQASTTFTGNHAWWVNGGRDWDAAGRPAALLVYDPLADGRRAGIAKSPFWLPRYYFERFASLLVVWPATGLRLGPGRAYVAFTRDTEPHVHLRYGGRAMRTLPNRKRVKAGYNIRSSPGGAKVARTTGGTWSIYQAATGPAFGGDTRWWGDHNGTRWIHESALER